MHEQIHEKYPDTLDNIFIEFAKDIFFKDKFKHYNNRHYQLSNNEMVLTKREYNYIQSVCYGAEAIQSLSSGIYKWTFKIKNKPRWDIGIGIDETKHLRKNHGHFGDHKGKSKCYVLYSNGDGRRWDHEYMIINPLAPTFETNDTVMMILDLSDQTLSYRVNKGRENVMFTDIATGNGINYCMAIYIGEWKGSVQLCNSSVCW